MKFHLLLIASLIGYFSFSQSNDCSPTPTNLPVNASCTPQTFNNTQNGTNPEINSSCAGGYGNGYEDVWYSITGTGNTVSITASGANEDLILAAFTSCAAGEIICTQVDVGFAGTISFSTTLGTTYFIQIQRRTGGNNGDMSGDICAVDPSLGASASNDDPCTATALTVGTSCTFVTGTNVGATDTPGIPAPGCANYSGGDVWFSVVVPAGGAVNIEANSVTGGISDGGMAAYSALTCASAMTLIDCNDDGGAGLMPLLSLTGLTPGTTIWIRMWEYGNDVTGEFDICATIPPPPPSNIICATPEPICSGSSITFTAQSSGTDADVTNPGNDYGCLAGTPNPTWFYLEIATPGDVAIDITAGSDIDFALWGPYANLAAAISDCDSYPAPIDCSFSIAATEQANVTGVTAGEVYILLVTNYASVVQDITLDEASSMTASTNCAIVLGVDLTAFNGVRVSDGNFIEWSTLSEKDNSHFIIERSSDNEVWTVVDVVEGAGNSTQTVHYSVTDRNIDTEKQYYYRLKQFDLDGTLNTSSTILVSNQLEVINTLSPNPTNSKVTVRSSEFMSSIELVSINGKVLKTVEPLNKTKVTNVDVHDLRPGVYYVTIRTDNGNVSTERLVVN